MNKKRLMYASLIGVASVLACVAQAAHTDVPIQWDVKPWNTNGPTLETFNGATLPLWAPSSEAELKAVWTNRVDRFWKTEYLASNQLVFATLGITNTFSNAKIQPGVPIFVDMRCKLNPFDATTQPKQEDFNNTVLCFYANDKSNLVVASSLECKTNATIVDPTVYYPIMIRFSVATNDVFFNNDPNPTVSLVATKTELSKMVISGAGEMDDLYVSYGDPRRGSTNSLVVCNTGDDGWASNPGPEESVIRNWLANNALAGTYTKGNAEKFYLTDTPPTNTVFGGEIGIGSFAYDPNRSNVTVVVTLNTGADKVATKKNGKINGVLELKGAGDYNTAKSGGWGVVGSTTILTNDFVSGTATYTFKLTGDSNTNKFFLPVIKSNIKVN